MELWEFQWGSSGLQLFQWEPVARASGQGQGQSYSGRGQGDETREVWVSKVSAHSNLVSPAALVNLTDDHSSSS